MFVVILSILTLFLGGMAYYLFFLAPKLDPKNRADELIKQNRVQEALTEYKKVLDTNPFDFITHFRIASIYLKLKEYDQAALHFEKVLDINKYNYEVDKLTIQKQLAKIYYFRNEIEGAFRIFLDILQLYPSDEECLYHVAFIALGQEEFDIAQPFFERLIKIRKNDFDIYFGTAICSYQNQRYNDAIKYFKAAEGIKAHSDIVNLALVFSTIKKREFRQAMTYLQKLLQTVKDPEVYFIVLRLEAYLLMQLTKYDEAISKFLALIEFTLKNELIDEHYVSQYDMGFAYVAVGNIEKAYEYWNKLANQKRNYKNLPHLIMTARREMDEEAKRSAFEESVKDHIEDWLQNMFPAGLLWGICGLRNPHKFEIRNMVVSTKVAADKDADMALGVAAGGGSGFVDAFCDLENDTFRLIANRVVNKIGYKVDEIMNTYKESDGIDFMAVHKETKEKTYVWVRRWKKTKIGEIPLRNFAQAVNDLRVKKGLLVTTAELTDSAKAVAERLTKIKIVPPEELNMYLKGLL